MGDRANFGIRQADGNTVFVYGHWAGDGMLHRFAKAINRVAEAGRVGDDAYATRIIISDLIGDEWKQDLSWGITVNVIGDNEHKIPVYDLASDTVTLYDYDWIRGDGLVLTNVIARFDRAGFVKRYSKVKVGA